MSEYDRRQIDEDFRERAPMREYFCRTCRGEAVTKGIPPGWYSLKAVSGGDNPKTSGLFCSVPCLAHAVRDLEARL